MKRTPLLADEFLHLGPKHIPKDWMPQITMVQRALRGAKVFRFDEQAACYAAHMMVAHPEAIARDVDFAIPPFPRMYIEFPYPRFYDITSPPDYRGKNTLDADEEDADVGYLYDGPLVYVLSRANQRARMAYPMVLPIRYRLNRNYTFEEELATSRLLETSRLGIDSFMWGSCYRTLVQNKDTASLRALRENHSSEFWYGTDLRNITDLQATVLKTSAGDLRNIVAMILFLNRTRELQIMDDVPPAPGFVRAKPRTLVRHSVVRLRLDPGPLLKRTFASRATGGWRREHDVRGHWCHDRNYHAAHHEHDLREIGVNHWKCLLCGGQRWWRKAHHRGRKDHGQVKTTYEVSK